MSDLVAFLRARLDEEEAAARQAHTLFIRFEEKPGDWTRLMCDPIMGPFGGQSPTRDIVTGLYVGKMSDPARVLREVEAKRAILDLIPTVIGDEWRLDGEFRIRPRDEGDEPFTGTLILRVLAAVYRDHPDYDPAWASGAPRQP
ncbi:MAG TPA: DUF6221 family protein [Streptosporangiaceae bacterium]